ncbi:kinase-like domain-containing protein [Mycena belliarum]|uniref:Kinase-like domain-containing protein n=1 Tax=Mycena belliarum TaxID=1033014 RepID=A0AAD6UAV7_9AGAR|nr:kinase-like domain-containing protein [Mycena belliae]
MAKGKAPEVKDMFAYLDTEEHRQRFPKLHINDNFMEEGRLATTEFFWRDHYAWLKDAGYLLRSRYSPGWSASWKGTSKSPFECEDGVMSPAGVVMDATRLSDGSSVVLKQCDRMHSDASLIAFREVFIFHKFSTDPLASDPRNHCISLTEVLHVPDDDAMDIVVMPLLQSWKLVEFSTAGEVVDFISQIVEGLQFMHEKGFWHGDVKYNSIMMDASPLLIDDVNPWDPEMTRDLSRDARFRNRTEHPVRYYWIDFDLTGEHDPSQGPPLVEPKYGGTRQVPEFEFPEKCNPFAVDVWCLGFFIHVYFMEGADNLHIKKRRGCEFMLPLVSDMMNQDPAKRPSMDEVVRRFSDIKAGLTEWNLRARFAACDENPVLRIIKSTKHWSRQLMYKSRGIAAIPRPVHRVNR